MRPAYDTRRRHALCAAMLSTLLALPADAHSQEPDEPTLAQVREVFSQPGLTLGLLLQAVVDAGLDTDPASAQVAAARVLASGVLDGGFEYRLQTNFAAAPALLDAQVGWSAGTGFTVAAGRFKTPFSRELLTFAGSIDFVNRSRVVDALAPGRQMGAQVGGRAGGHLGWSVGGFTGGTNATPNEALTGVARVEGRSLGLGGGVLSVAAHAAVGRDAAIATAVNGAAFQGDGTLLGVDGRFERGRALLAGEIIRADWDPVVGPDTDAQGLYLTAGWMVVENHQWLARWDRYRAPTGPDDDVLVLGYNTWPTGASEIQANWVVPFADSGAMHKLLVNFQIGF